jgi:predicted nuclease with RNAse H fold
LLALGVDLAGSEGRPTGMCYLSESMVARTWVCYSDEEILSSALTYQPGVVAVDAPLSLPRGRKDIEDRSGPHFRKCDRQLLAMSIKFFPVTIGPMRSLTRRGMRVKELLESRGFRVIEVYPGGAQDVLGVPRKGKGLASLRRGLRRLGVRGLSRGASDHELDAAFAAIVGLEYLQGKAVALGDPEEGLIYMPGGIRPVGKLH